VRHKGKVGWGVWEIVRFRVGIGTGSELPETYTQCSGNPGGDPPILGTTRGLN
jgi:hypothetical protein